MNNKVKCDACDNQATERHDGYDYIYTCVYCGNRSVTSAGAGWGYQSGPCEYAKKWMKHLKDQENVDKG